MTNPSNITTPPADGTGAAEPAADAGAPSPPAAEPGSGDHAAGTAENGGEEPLGEAGRKALQAERDAARKAREDAERHREQAEAAQARLAELEAAELRRGVAADKGLTAEQAELLVGEDAEQMAAHADRMLAAFAPADDEDRPSVRRLPQERLRPGAVPSAGDGDEIAEIAERVAGY